MIDKVVMASYRRHAGKANVLNQFRIGIITPAPDKSPADHFLRALSNLRTRDRTLLQLRFWDGLAEDEAAEVLGLTMEQVRERLAQAGINYLGKLARTHPDLALSDVVDTIKSIKPGIHRRRA